MKQAYYRGGKMSSIRSKVAGVWVALAILASLSLALGVVGAKGAELIAVHEGVAPVLAGPTCGGSSAS
jgi:hypothetical protein